MLFRLSAPALLMPPSPAAEFPLSVLFVTVVVLGALVLMPPPRESAELPLIVLLVTVSVAL
jgi:hypothetical protein